LLKKNKKLLEIQSEFSANLQGQVDLNK